MRKFLKKYYPESIIFGFFAVIYVLFCSYYMIELPHLSWFEQVIWIDKYFNGTLTIHDLFSSYCEHGMLGTNLLMILNSDLFGLSTLFDVYLNDILVILTGIIGLVTWKKYNSNEKKTWIYIVGIFLTCFFLFNVLQGSSGAMETQVRLGLFFSILSMFLCDKFFRTETTKRYKVVMYVVVVLSINVFGTLYSIAAAAGICLICLGRIITKRANRNVVCLIMVIIFCWMLYFVEYRTFSNISENSIGVTNFVRILLMDLPTVLKSLVAFSGSFLLGYPSMADHLISDQAYLTIGLFVLMITVFCCCVYVKNKYYKRTFLPFFFILYAYAVWFMVLVGRYDQINGEWMWSANNWYFVHTKIATVSIVWILLLYIKDKRSRLLKTAGIITLTYLVTVGLFGYYTELKRVPYEKAYYAKMQPYLFAQSIDELPVDENNNTPLIHTPETTWESIEILKKYNLSVYRYYDAYNRMEEIRNGSLSNIGLYEDGWVEPNAQVSVLVGDKGIIKLSGRYNQEITGNEVISVYDGEKLLTEHIISTPDFTFEIPSKPNSKVNLTIKCNFSFEPNPPDVRKLSFILDELSGQ